MPGMGGQALLVALRERNPEIPIVALTGHPPQGDDPTPQPNGFDAYLTKPTTLEILAQTVRALLDRT